jgi:hypothetical protein
MTYLLTFIKASRGKLNCCQRIIRKADSVGLGVSPKTIGFEIRFVTLYLSLQVLLSGKEFGSDRGAEFLNLVAILVDLAGDEEVLDSGGFIGQLEE